MLMATLQGQAEYFNEGSLYPVPSVVPYPPTSLQSLLRMFVTGDPQALVEKKCIVNIPLPSPTKKRRTLKPSPDLSSLLQMYYFLLDWMHSNKLNFPVFEEFANTFNLPPQYRLLISGFWLLDDARATEVRQPQHTPPRQFFITLSSSPHACIQAVQHFNSVQTKTLVQEWAAPIVSALHDLQEYFFALALGDASLPTLPSLQEAVVQMRLLLHNNIITKAFSFQV